MENQNRTRKIIPLFFSFLSLLLFTAIIPLRFYTRTRMGMQRHIGYLSMKWEKNYNIGLIKVISIAIIIILILILLVTLFKMSKDRSLSFGEIIVITEAFMLPLFTVIYLLMRNRQMEKGYYGVGILLILSSLSALCGAILLPGKNRKGRV